jgi:hypothetical protein
VGCAFEIWLILSFSLFSLSLDIIFNCFFCSVLSFLLLHNFLFVQIWEPRDLGDLGDLGDLRDLEHEFAIVGYRVKVVDGLFCVLITKGLNMDKLGKLRKYSLFFCLFSLELPILTNN